MCCCSVVVVGRSNSCAFVVWHCDDVMLSHGSMHVLGTLAVPTSGTSELWYEIGIGEKSCTVGQ